MHIASYKIIIEKTIPGIEIKKYTIEKNQRILRMLLKLVELI